MASLTKRGIDATGPEEGREVVLWGEDNTALRRV